MLDKTIKYINQIQIRKLFMYSLFFNDVEINNILKLNHKYKRMIIIKVTKIIKSPNCSYIGYLFTSFSPFHIVKNNMVYL